MFERGRWIWYADTSDEDTYGEFYAPFTATREEGAVCRISCDGDYALYLNGEFVDSDQYGDYEHYKIFDEIDLSDRIRTGINHFAVRVWHIGAATQRHKPAQAGVIFEAESGGKIVLASGDGTAARQSRALKNGYRKFITSQLGFSFLYDATKEDDWKTGGGEGFSEAVIVGKKCLFFPRPTKKTVYGEEQAGKIRALSDCEYLVDLGKERTGMPYLKLNSPVRQKITVSYGEHLDGGRVRRRVGRRDFSFEYIAAPGENSFFHPFLLLGCRYLEVSGGSGFDLRGAGCVAHYYPVKRATFTPRDPEDARIYEMCVNTLELCMAGHYMDCPWREQDLYVFDARNQMLAGYAAFEDGNRDYARANLLLMSKDRCGDGLMPICFPCGVNLTIPSFTLHYFTAVEEYTRFTGDRTLAKEVYGRLQEILDVFASHMRGGLEVRFTGKDHWNFYDWSGALAGNLYGEDEEKADLMLNALTVRAMDKFEAISSALGKMSPYTGIRNELAQNIVSAFFDGDKGLFRFEEGSGVYPEFGNALCVLCGITPDGSAEKIRRAFLSGEMLPCTLATRAFKYDALIAAGKREYTRFILGEIRHDYGAMLDAGSATTWETVTGAADFGGAGSLCHGWSALPAYYYRLLADKNFSGGKIAHERTETPFSVD